MRPSLFIRLLSSICLLGTMSSGAVFATSFTWTGSTNSDWRDFSNWNPSTSFPGNSSSSDTALFDSTGLIKIVDINDSGSPDPSLSSLTFQDNYTLNTDPTFSFSLLTTSGLSTVEAGTLTLGDLNHQSSFSNSPFTVNSTFLNGDLKVNSGATLSGFGRVTNLDNYGTVAPGVPELGGKFNVGQSNLGGNFTAEPGSFLRIRLLKYDPPVSVLDNDILQVNGVGNTTLLPGSNLVITPQQGAFILNFDYVVLQSVSQNNLSGTFNLIQPSAFDGSLIYNYTPGAGSVTYTINGLTSAVPNGGATYANQQLALAQLSTWFDSSLRDRILGYASDKEGEKNTNPLDPTVWVTVANENNKLSDNGNGFKANPKGLAIGLEKSTSDTLCGLGLAYTRFTTDGFFVDEHSRSKGNLYQIGSYGSHDKGNWRWGGNIALGITNDINTERDLDMGIDTATVRGKHKAHRFSAETQASYLGFHTYNNTAALQPLVGVGYQWLGSNHFNEQGDTTLELDVSHANYYSLHSRLGFTLEATNQGIHPFALAAWEHEFGNKTSTVSVNLVSLAASPVETFRGINGTPINREVFATKLGLAAKLQQVDFSAFYEGRHTSHYHENSGRVQASYNIL